jgi:cysteine desulfurase family protein (TIGR01976 family)
MLNLPEIRSHFPALASDTIFLDNPGGTQICQQSMDRLDEYYLTMNANHEGAFETSARSDAAVEAAHAVMADFLHASRPEEIIFGMNMTTLTYTISRALGRTFKPGDTIVVTKMDHDANISPWLQVAEDRGCRIRWVNFHQETGTLDLEDFQAAMQEKPKLVAVGYASNALGTINPVEKLVEWAHAAGALIYIDAVQYAPHGPIDVQKLGCDFLVCSAYKFFGPHIGILYGRYEILDALKAYRVRPASSNPPGKFETGTGSFEAMHAVSGTMEYLVWVGETYGAEHLELLASQYTGRALAFKKAMLAMRAYEYELNRKFLEIFDLLPDVTLYGSKEIEPRVATFSFRVKNITPRQVAKEFGKAGINIWDGNFYALAVTQHLGVEESGGLVRVGAVHYNTFEEIRAFGEALQRITT